MWFRVSPAFIRPNSVTVCHLDANGTTWAHNDPAFGLSDLPGASVTDIGIIDDEHATAVLTVGPATGKLTWHDNSGTNLLAYQNVGAPQPRFVPRRLY